MTPDPSIPVDQSRDSYSVAEAARLLGRSHSTITNWINAKRIEAWSVGPVKRPSYRIAVVEARRIADVLGVSEQRGPLPASVVVVDAAGAVVSDAPEPVPVPDAKDESSITWFVPPEERYSKPPAA